MENSKINIPNGETYDVKFEKDQILWKNKKKIQLQKKI